MANKNVSVVVLGDIGRSPRMQYHALSFAKEGFNVDFIGYAGSEPISELTANSSVKFRYINPSPDFKKYCPHLMAYALKVIWQSITLFLALLFKRRSHHIIVQNPPAIPALAVCWFYSVLATANYVIDWHNYGFSIMALTLGKRNKLVQVSEWLERNFGKLSNGNLCVTTSMKTDLAQNWTVLATTLYDRPPQHFRSISVAEKHSLFKKLAEVYEVFQDDNNSGQDTTLFSEVRSDGKLYMRDDRPALLVSSTSWTEDEDFLILLSALQDYEGIVSLEPKVYPRLICAVTGKGPQKDYYKKIIDERQWKNVHVITPWLEPEDYPLLLASADLGVCLHTSSSGLDLPMKVVDMFGCGLPVCAYSYPCLSELVKHEVNGYVFSNPNELSQQLQNWFRGFPNNKKQQETVSVFRKELEKFQELRWHENWKFTALPLFPK